MNIGSAVVSSVQGRHVARIILGPRLAESDFPCLDPARCGKVAAHFEEAHAMQLFTDDTGFEAGRKSVRYTTSRLAADPAQEKNVKPFRALLAIWNQIEQERRDSDDALVDAN